MKVLTASQMQRIDRQTTEQAGVPSLTLMENAGAGVVEFLAARFAPLEAQKIAILCGRGNNGGDGLVVARLLRERGVKPRVVLFADPARLKGDAAENYRRLASSGAPESAPDLAAWQNLKPQLEGATLILDALLGTGLSKPLEGFLLQVVEDVNGGFPQARVVAVDLPSGLSADSREPIGPCARADACVTFTAPKHAHVFPPACQRVGEWVVKNIGTPPEMLSRDADFFLNLATAQDFAWLAEPRAPQAHKGNFGHVLVVAGSVGKTGAASLAAEAALRAGAGLVTVATPSSALPIVAGLGREYMTEPLPETPAGTISLRALDEGRMDGLLEGKNVLAVGPGISTHPETAEFVRALVNRYDRTLVLDADGLNAFAGRVEAFREGKAYSRPAVLTPHPGEMSRLAGRATAEIQADRLAAARDFAAQHHAHLVLKGYRTLTASPDGQVWVNPTGNPGMATGGTGDVLTGLMAGLLAQFAERPAIEVAAAAVYLHGLAGDLACRKMGEVPMIAGDLLAALPEAFRSVAEGRWP